MFRVKPDLKEQKMFQTASYIFNILSPVPLPSFVSKYFGIKSMKLSKIYMGVLFSCTTEGKPIKLKYNFQ